MHSLKTTTCAGQIFALAKPHDSLGKRTRNRIPKEERKALVESFIKKHQNLNNGSFPSLSLTHKEVGGSFYTIREIVREIIQENRVLGTSDLILEGKSQVQSLSSSTLMDPVPPLSLSPDGFHSASDQSNNFSFEAVKTKSPENGENINGSQASEEVNGHQHNIEDIGLLVHEPVPSTDVSGTQFAASCSEENDTKHDAGLHDRVQTVSNSFASKPHDKEIEVEKKDRGFEEIPFFESEGTKPVNDDKRVNDAGAVMTEMVIVTKNTLDTVDLPAETFPSGSVTSTMESSDLQPSELVNVCEGGNGAVAKVETDSSTVTSVDLGEISSSTFVVPEKQGTEVIVGQMPDPVSVPTEKKVEEKIVNPASVDVECASVDVECADTKGTVVANPVIGNIQETNGSLTTEQKMPTSGTESGSCKNDIAKLDTTSSHARNEVASVEKAIMEKGKLDASDSSSSQKGNIAPLNRIKPESWKGQSNAAGQETNPLLAVLKSFLTAFVKFWTEE
ncbi:hypothetical protein EUTSA_v10010306mg [Eutrema salsugineum]|uniref:AT3G52170-like helix-turn-helix domain-containing protein n=1 Tax=Eutrema salsugineum TaxID=72664 RepID=V4LS20_EUTSA|nr:uncharacterized protein LOC18021569 [Eutrema salsugineum]ESQ45287.1 hypothetical protein EUTSA_v10010306mg [Eutrema salsugineum]